jgi:hypothetical protein
MLLEARRFWKSIEPENRRSGEPENRETPEML